MEGQNPGWSGNREYSHLTAEELVRQLQHIHTMILDLPMGVNHQLPVLFELYVQANLHLGPHSLLRSEAGNSPQTTCNLVAAARLASQLADKLMEVSGDPTGAPIGEAARPDFSD